MMLFDAVLYFVIGWYIEEVFPGRYGVPRRWYFPFTKSYWLGLNQQVSTAAQQSDNDAVQSSSTSSLSSSSPNFETDPLNLSIGIKVNSLSKTYDNGKKALKDVSFRLYEGQIAALLGHNGAGKVKESLLFHDLTTYLFYLFHLFHLFHFFLCFYIYIYSYFISLPLIHSQLLCLFYVAFSHHQVEQLL